MRLRLVPELGTQFMSEIERPDLQSLVNHLQGHLSASKVHGCVNAARVLWRDFDLITGANNALIIDPTKGAAATGGARQRDRPDRDRR